ncbi:MAG: 3-phosphoshikimate 1-carboxyvinyltransferase [Clostridia bacterium]|nr:3-phosphoshikimate 1-carboxyvinyltransferase [Clostridia bacterium]
MMNTEVSLRNIKGTVNAPSSKSDVHRILIASALSDRPTKLLINSASEDIEATCSCLKMMGADIKKDGTGIIVTPIKNVPDEAVLNCVESGSTMRFLMPVASALGINATFTGSDRLTQRPHDPLLDALKKNGVTVHEGFPIKISEQLESGVFEIQGDVSSQFISGLMFALPLLEGNSEIRLTTPAESKPYIDMTVSTLKNFNIEIAEKGNSYFINGNGKYISPEEITAQGDWSNGAFWLCLGALSCITVNGLNNYSLQGDRRIIEILRSMGADVTLNYNSVSVKKNELHGIKIDASDIPDLVPVISALACFAQGTTTITNAKRLRFKESDRLKAVADLIETAGGDVTELPDSLIINGGMKLKDRFAFNCRNDHRMVMAATLFSFASDVTITDAQAVNKSYPHFFNDIKALGGVCNVINDR